MLARNRQLADANLGLHGVGLVDDDDAPRRRRRLDRLRQRQRRRAASAPNTFSHLRERLVGGRVADHGQDHVVRHEVAAVERLQVVARDAGQRLRRAAARQAVGMEAVDQPVEDRRGHVVGIVGADLQRRDGLLLLPVDLLGVERRVADHVGQQVHRRRRTSPSSPRRWRTTGRSRSRCRARRRSCRSGRRSAAALRVVVPWSSRLPTQAREPGLALRILRPRRRRRAGASSPPAARGAGWSAPACRWRACGSRRAETSPPAPAAAAAGVQTASWGW